MTDKYNKLAVKPVNDRLKYKSSLDPIDGYFTILSDNTSASPEFSPEVASSEFTNSYPQNVPFTGPGYAKRINNSTTTTWNNGWSVGSTTTYTVSTSISVPDGGPSRSWSKAIALTAAYNGSYGKSDSKSDGIDWTIPGATFNVPPYCRIKTHMYIQNTKFSGVIKFSYVFNASGKYFEEYLPEGVALNEIDVSTLSNLARAYGDELLPIDFLGEDKNKKFVVNSYGVFTGTNEGVAAIQTAEYFDIPSELAKDPSHKCFIVNSDTNKMLAKSNLSKEKESIEFIKNPQQNAELKEIGLKVESSTKFVSLVKLSR